jgi:hypothetical protein
MACMVASTSAIEVGAVLTAAASALSYGNIAQNYRTIRSATTEAQSMPFE